MANDMELQLSFSYDKNDLNNMLAQMEKAVENADLDPNITGKTKEELKDFQKEIKKFVKQTTKDFDSIKGISLDSKAFDQYVKITDKRLDALEGTVNQVIETLKGVDSSTDLSSIGKAFDNLKEKVLANNAAIKEMVDTASELGAKVKLDVSNETEIDNILAKTKELREIFKEDYSSRVKSKSGYDKLGDELKEVNSQVKELGTLRASIEDKKSIEYLKIDAERTELLAKRYELAKKIISIEEKEPDFLSDGSYNKMAAQVEEMTDKIIENIDKSIIKLSELKQAQKEGYSIASSEEMGGAKGDIPIKTSLKIVTTSTEMFEAIKAKIADVQKKVNAQAIIIPVRYSLGSSRDNAENPLAPTSKEIKEARKAVQEEGKEVVVDFNEATEKMLNVAIDKATKSAKSAVKTVQKTLEQTPVGLTFDITETEKQRITELITSAFMGSKINITDALEEANKKAARLLEILEDVYKTTNLDYLGDFKQRLKEATNTTKKIAEENKKVETVKSNEQLLEKSIEDAKRIHTEVQDVFNKNKINVKLTLEKSQLDSVRDKIADANLDKSLDIAGSLKEAVIASHNIAENLNSIKDTNIKISGGRGTKTDLSNIEQNVSTVLIGLKTINDSIGKLQTAIKNIGKNDSGVKDLTGDFDRIIAKLDEMMEASDKLVNDIRNDVSTIDTAFKELGLTIDRVLDKNAFGETMSKNLEEMRIGFNNLIKMLFEVINAIDRVKANAESINKQTFDSQLQALGEIDNKALKKTVDLVKELDTTLLSIQKSSSAIDSVSNIKSLFDSLNIKDDKLERIKQIPEALKVISEQVKELNNLPTSKFVEQISEVAKQGEGLKALSEVLKHSQKEISAAIEISRKKPNEAYQNLEAQLKEAVQIEKIYKNISKAGTFETSQPKEYAEVLEIVRDNLEKIQNIREFHANDDKVADATIGQIYDSRKVQDLISNTKELFEWLENIKNSNKELLSQLNTELKVTNDFKKQYKKLLDNGGISERSVTADYVDSVRQIRDVIDKLQKYDGLKIATQDDIANVKTLNNQLSTLFRTISSISSFTSDIEKQITDEITKTKKYERDFSRSWGYGTIERNYGDEYSATLSDIREKIEEVKRLENQPPSDENLINIKKINKDIETLYTKLKEINAIAKETKITNMANKISQYLQKNPNLTIAQYTKAINELNKLKPGITVKELNEIATAFNNIQYSAKMAGREGSNFLDAIRNKLKYGWAQSIAMFFSFYDIIRYIREISGTVTELNSSLIELAKVSDSSIGELYRDFSDFKDIAEQTGGTINDIINSTADWARNGFNLPNSKELARLSSIFQNIGDGLSEAQANEYLVSTLKGFNFDDDEVVERAIEIMDKINNVSNNAASSVSNIGEALERSSSAFGAANTNLSEAVALLTSANEVLQNPETVGTAFKSKFDFVYRNMHIEHI